jgi:hypothetical protein
VLFDFSVAAPLCAGLATVHSARISNSPLEEVPMTLQLCVSPCALACVERAVRWSPVVRGSPDPALATTEGLPISTAGTITGPRSIADFPAPGESPEFPDDDCAWEEFDPTPLESWILDDFDWDIEESYPERGDYWDDSLDGEWDVGRTSWKSNPNSSHNVIGGLTPPRSPRRRFARQCLAGSVFPGGFWEQAS